MLRRTAGRVYPRELRHIRKLGIRECLGVIAVYIYRRAGRVAQGFERHYMVEMRVSQENRRDLDALTLTARTISFACRRPRCRRPGRPPNRLRRLILYNVAHLVHRSGGQADYPCFIHIGNILIIYSINILLYHISARLSTLFLINFVKSSLGRDYTNCTVIMRHFSYD